MATSDVVLGAKYFGTDVDEPTAFVILDRFVEAGGTTIDAADCNPFAAPGAGAAAEAVIGRWLQANAGARPELVLSTKVGIEAGDDGGPQGLTAEAILRGFQGSRQRLGCETIDVYWADRDDRDAELAETVGSLGALVALGSVGRVGASNYATWRVERARAVAGSAGMPGFSALQLSTSYLRPQVPSADATQRFSTATDETFDFVAQHPEFVLWGSDPLLDGCYEGSDLPGEYDHPGARSRLDTLGQVAARHSATASQVVLAWLVAGSPSVRPIVNVTSVEQLESVLAAGNLELEPDDVVALDSVQ